MKLTTILQKGFFPKELPPPFNTEEFGRKHHFILKFIKNKSIRHESRPCPYSYHKGKYSRRFLDIINPFNYLLLAHEIHLNWDDLREIPKKSKYSSSRPVLYKADRLFRTKSKSFNLFRMELIAKSFNKKYELRFDIASFYPSIYSHSITWSVLGGKDGKKYFLLSRNRKKFSKLIKSDPKALLYQRSTNIDTLLRNCRDRQSIGIPIGPDLSFLIAEIIGAEIDKEISENISNNILGTRYFDDYYFFCDTYFEAEQVLKISEKILNKFRLSINENKVQIKESPFNFEYKWSHPINAFIFKKVDDFELKSYFDIVNYQLTLNPNQIDQIINYSLLKFEHGYVKIPEESWDVFLIFILNLQFINASNLKQLLSIFLSYKVRFNSKGKALVKNTLERIIDEHSSLNHSHEVSWSLWIMISLRIKCNSELLEQVLISEDYISILVALDLISRRLYNGKKPSVIQVFKTVSTEDLYQEKWLLMYESVQKKWSNSTIQNIVSKDEFFNYLNHLSISFYDETAQIKPSFLSEDQFEHLTQDLDLFDFMDAHSEYQQREREIEAEIGGGKINRESSNSIY